jgi:hypothetical protein
MILLNSTEDFVQLYNLNPTTVYTVQVESRKESKRVDSFKCKFFDQQIKFK